MDQHHVLFGVLVARVHQTLRELSVIGHSCWWPETVRLNRVSWHPEKSPKLKNEGKTSFLEGPIDFASAKLTVNRGRDLVVLEHTPAGLIVHFADNPLGGSVYDVTISFGD